MADRRAVWPLRSRLLKYSIGLHVVAAGLLLANPATWPVVVSGVVADHLVLVGASLWPRSRLLGPNLTRLPASWVTGDEVALTFDDGPDPEVTPRILESLEAHRARATFFCIGHKVERHPGLVRAIAEAGHHVENHSYRHSNAFCISGPGSLRRDLDRAQNVIERCTGAAPAYFRAPAGLRNPWLDPVLVSRGLQLVSWTRRGFDTVARDPRAIVSRLTDGLAAGDVLVLHDAGCAGGPNGRPVVLEVLPRMLDELSGQGLRSIAIPRRVPAP